MKRKFFAFIALMAATFSLSSCLSSDDDTNVEYTHDTAITAFSLGTMDRYTKTAAGKDTLLKSNLDASGYKFYIDQTTRQIYNVDSLPCGVRDTAVLATISSKNSSPIILEDIDKADSLIYYSSSDSINFSKPRKIRVYNNDFSAYVTYTVTVNVHKELPDEFNWHTMVQGNAQLAALSDMKLLAFADYIYVFGKTADGMKIYKTSMTEGTVWLEVTPNQTFAADDYKNAVVMDGNIIILSGGKVYLTADAANWVQVGEDNSQIKQLVGASSKYLYAYTTSGGIAVSENRGATWTAQTLDKKAEYLPNNNISMTVSPIRSTKNAENIPLMGTRDEAMGDTIATIWTHTVDYDASLTDNMWNYYEQEKNQAYKMPMMDEVLACPADSGLVALGSNGKWYKSTQGGLTWKVDSLVTLPAEFLASDAASTRFGFCRDANNYYWIIRNGYVWKGRFNKDGWRKE